MQDYPLLDTPAILSSIFFPRNCERTTLPPGAQDVDIETESGIIIGCRFYIKDRNAPNLIFFHGNGEIAADYDEIGPLYNQNGMNLLVTDYRGYGWSSGTPTVSNMLSDAEILFREILNWLSYNTYTGKTFLMGRSLGSVAVIDIAARDEKDINGIILESGIADTIPLGKTLGFAIDEMDFSEEDGFRNLEKIEKITKPTFILHGALDELIPAVQAEKLQSFSGAKTKEFIIIPGAAHNTMIATGGMLYFQTIKKFIDKVTGVTNWRKRRKKSTAVSGE